MYSDYDYRKAIENASDKVIPKRDRESLLFDLDVIESGKEAWELRALTKYIDTLIDGLRKSVGLRLYDFAVLH